MAKPPPDTAARKEPRQARSRRMRERILAAAVRVLDEEGALGFTTTKVADEAQVSVGSLYQYFPNKHALVIALHTDVVRAGWEHVQTILGDHRRSAREKVRDIAQWYFAVESEDVSRFGSLFDDLDVFMRDSGVHDQVKEDAARHFHELVAGAIGQAAPTSVAFAADLLMTTLEQVGKAVATRRISLTEQRRWARATADMLCDHLGFE